MKRILVSVLFVIALSNFVIWLGLGCGGKDTEPQSRQQLPAESAPPQVADVRVYEFDYEWDLEGLSENHFIVLESLNDSLSGRYYGTSDDFDDFREGYSPGFFVASMDSLLFADGKIEFSLRVIRGTLFNTPVDFRFTSAAQAHAAGYQPWLASFPEYELSRTSRHYSGTYTSDRIELQMPEEKRVFKRKEQLARQNY